MADIVHEDYNRDPTLAVFHEPYKSVRYDMTLTNTGEVKFVRVECAGVHEDAPLQIDVTMKDAEDVTTH